MTTATRTDIHRPSAPEFDPQAYELIEVFDRENEWGTADRVATVNAMISAGYRFAAHQKPGTCGHCGTHLRYAALMAHETTRDMIWVGETCLDDRFSDMTAARFAQLRDMAAADRRQILAARHIEELTHFSPFIADLTYPELDYGYGDFLASLAEQLRAKGELSNRQIEALDKSMLRYLERANKRQAEAELPTSPAPEGKVTVTGEIVAVRDQDGYAYGTTDWKITVRDDRGFKVWLTLPASLRRDAMEDGGKITDLRGRRVEFTATLTRSDRDEAFSFGKRPAKARLLGE